MATGKTKKDYNKDYWQRNKQRLLDKRRIDKGYKERSNLYYQKRRHTNKIRVLGLVENPICCRCGFDDKRALHFHHIDDKEFEIMKVLSSNRKVDWKSIEKEVKKCELICANCHAIEHSTFDV